MSDEPVLVANSYLGFVSEAIQGFVSEAMGPHDALRLFDSRDGRNGGWLVGLCKCGWVTEASKFGGGDAALGALRSAWAAHRVAPPLTPRDEPRCPACGYAERDRVQRA